MLGEPLHIASEYSVPPSSLPRQPRGSLLAALQFIINYKVGNYTDQRVALFAHGRRWMLKKKKPTTFGAHNQLGNRGSFYNLRCGVV